MVASGAEVDRSFRFAAALTLVAFLLHPPTPWAIRLPVLALSGLGLVWPRSAAMAPLWLGLAGATAARVVLDWPLADNHAYLAAIWCLAVALALATSRPGASLALSARWLVALVFGLATLWKGVLSPDYLDGTFFRFTAMIDPRFEAAAHWLGGMEPALRDANRAAILASLDGGVGAAPALEEPARFGLFVTFSTLWTLLIEGAVALAFALPAVPAPIRHGLLLLFCATTFAIAPVPGFGWLLLALGASQVRDAAPGWLAGHGAVAGLILAYELVPWAGLV